MRALPGGPTPIDMAANAALLVGLTWGLHEDIDRLLPRFPFKYADYNFYRSAQHGLDATLLWPTATCGNSPREIKAKQLILDTLPIAEKGLEGLGVSTQETKRMLEVISERVRRGNSGARWQRQVLTQLDQKMPRGEALSQLLAIYLEHAETGKPVSDWPLST